MSSSVIGSLRVNLGLDSAQFERGAKKTQPAINSMKAGFLAVGAAAATMAAAIGVMASKGAADIDAAAKSARRLDASIGAFRGLELAADEAGVSLSSLTNDIQTMNRELAKGGTGVEAALAKLGLTAAQLEAMDVDEKIATIADRIDDLGMSAGEATAILQAFGIRNREMVLLLAGGGDAIRAASADIQDYGLAITQVESDGIEKANDAISRLGVIGQYAGQQLALVLYPALGRMAEAMTDSLREGGVLRAVLDGLVNVVRVLWSAVEGLVAAFSLLRTAMDMPERAFRWLFDLGPTSLQTRRATDELTLSIREQMRALDDLLGQMGPGVTMSKEMATALLQEAESRLAVIEATRQQALELVKQSDAYRTIENEILGIQERLAEYNYEVAQAAEQGLGENYSLAAEDVEFLIDRLGEASAEIVAMLGHSSQLSPEYVAIIERIEQLKGELADATDETLTFAAATDDAADSAEKLRQHLLSLALGGEVVGQVNILAQRLGVALDVATALNATLNANAGIDMGGGSTGPDLSFGLGPALQDDVGNAVLGFGDLSNAVATTRREVTNLSTSTSALSASLGEGGGGGGGGGGVAESIEQVTANILEMGAASVEAAEAAIEYARTLETYWVDGITQAVDWMVDGFEGGLGSIWDMFVKTIKEMITYALTNQILFSMGLGGVDPGGAGEVAEATGLGSLFTGFSTGISTVFGEFTSALTGGDGLTTALGAATAAVGDLVTTGFAAGSSLASIGAAIGAIAMPVMAVLAVFELFKVTTTVIDAGLRVTIDGLNAMVEEFETIHKSSFFGLFQSTSTNYNTADASIADPIDQAYNELRATMLDMAEVIGIGSKALRGFSYQFELSTIGMSQEEAEAALAAEFEALGEAMAMRLLRGHYDAMQEGEMATDTLLRLSNSLMSTNAAFAILGTTLLDASVTSGVAASAFVEALGGLEVFADGIDYYFANFYTLAEQANVAADQFAAGMAGVIDGYVIPATIEDFRSQVDQLLAIGETAAAGALISLAPLFEEMLRLEQELYETSDAFVAAEAAAQSASDAQKRAADQNASLTIELLTLQGDTVALRQLELAALEPANHALQQQIWALEEQAIAAVAAADAQRLANDQNKALTIQLLTLQGNTVQLREMELAALEPANHALQQQVWALQDQAVAAQAATEAAQALADAQAAITAERLSLETQLLTLQGNLGELRVRERAALDASNRGLQAQIWALEDLAAATLIAEQAEADLAAQRAAIEQERLGLENQLLTLQGNTAELRRRELEALDPANRALQQMIWGLEDAKAAMDALDPNRFASLFDFRVAQGRLANGMPVANSNTPIWSPQAMGTGVADARIIEDHRALLTKIEKHTRDTANMLQKWDTVGPRQARTA